MDGEVDDSLTESWGLFTDSPALGIYEDDAYPGLFGVYEQMDHEKSPDFWNNGVSGFDFSDSGYVDQQLDFSVGAGMSIPTQVVSGQGVAGVGSADGSQGAMEAL